MNKLLSPPSIAFVFKMLKIKLTSYTGTNRGVFICTTVSFWYIPTKLLKIFSTATSNNFSGSVESSYPYSHEAKFSWRLFEWRFIRVSCFQPDPVERVKSTSWNSIFSRVSEDNSRSLAELYYLRPCISWNEVEVPYLNSWEGCLRWYCHLPSSLWMEMARAFRPPHLQISQKCYLILIFTLSLSSIELFYTNWDFLCGCFSWYVWA